MGVCVCVWGGVSEGRSGIVYVHLHKILKAKPCSLLDACTIIIEIDALKKVYETKIIMKSHIYNVYVNDTVH